MRLRGRRAVYIRAVAFALFGPSASVHVYNIPYVLCTIYYMHYILCTMYVCVCMRAYVENLKVIYIVFVSGL